MAATSHDFWLANLTAPVWKALHLGVYAAWALVVAHAALGALQDERAAAPAVLLGAGVAGVLALHLAAAWRERRVDAELVAAGEDGWVGAGRVEEIAERRAKVVTLAGERVAIFRYDGKVSAVSNVCQHQNGPLGEGKILDGCITCPWHGYQYRPEDGASPPPFTERVPTFRVRVLDGRILVDPRPLPPGTRTEPARFDPATPARQDREAFFVGYLAFPESLKRFHRRIGFGLASAFALLAILVGASQRPLGAGDFEYGIESEIEGLLRAAPLAAIWRVGGAVDRPFEVVPLVGRGKHGPGAEVLALAGRPVRARGSWIRRGRESLFEIASAVPSPEPYAVPAVSDPMAAVSGARSPLGWTALAGEIVDSKCFLGVMKPGEGRSHKACAIRCVSGGSPAALVARGPAGETAVLWLVSPAGAPLGRELLDVVGEPVSAAGELVRLGDRVILVTERAKIRRLEPPAS
jgi:nitrite reductase/ring-hydroxylating ferredoxin subunit